MLLAAQAGADPGVIAMTNKDCFMVKTPAGYSMVAGFTTAKPGTVVVGRFQQSGVTRVVNSEGLDVAAKPHVFSVGLTRAEARTKWSANCTVQGRSSGYADLSDKR
jgi:hypothetical protein